MFLSTLLCEFTNKMKRFVNEQSIITHIVNHAYSEKSSLDEIANFLIKQLQLDTFEVLSNQAIVQRNSFQDDAMRITSTKSDSLQAEVINEEFIVLHCLVNMFEVNVHIKESEVT